jgi:plasmid stability protein
MPTLYVRDVPAHVYAALKQRAARNGRSIDTEALVMLEETIVRDHDYEQLTREIAEFARKHKLPPDAPRPEELIRYDRDHEH